MRVPDLLVLGSTAMLVWACTTTQFPEDPNAPQTGGNDCAVIGAIATEHFRFGADNPPPPLKALGEPAWKPGCDFSKHGFAFKDYVQPPPGSDPRQTLKWVAFGKPSYDGNGAVVLAEIMHGPLAGMGYECRVHSGIAGWTVGECKTSWVS